MSLVVVRYSSSVFLFSLNTFNGDVRKIKKKIKAVGITWKHWFNSYSLYVDENILWFQKGEKRWRIDDIRSEWTEGVIFSSFTLYSDNGCILRCVYRKIGTRLIDITDILYDEFDCIVDDCFRYYHTVICNKNMQEILKNTDDW